MAAHSTRTAIIVATATVNVAASADAGRVFIVEDVRLQIESIARSARNTRFQTIGLLTFFFRYTVTIDERLISVHVTEYTFYNLDQSSHATVLLL